MPKKNLRKVPPNIMKKVHNIENQYIVVGILKNFDRNSILEGHLSHLDITLDETSLIVPSEVMPKATQGKYSERNIDGYEIIRKDLPKETHYRTMEVPSWGSYYSTHEVDMPYEKYPRDYVSPRLSTIKIECQNTSPDLEKYAIKFEVSDILDKGHPTFEENLLIALNLLQENVYSCSVFASDSSFEDYLRTVQLAWEFLPPGNREDDIRRVFGRSIPTSEQITEIEARYDFIISLNPRELLYGSSGFQRYFGALLEDSLVVFENIKYGNALYVMHDDWEHLSTLSRLDLMSGRYGENFERVIHSVGWEQKVKEIIQRYRSSLL
jgi:hypothetical protein